MNWRGASFRGRGLHIALGGGLTLALVLASAVFSTWPNWRSLPEDAGVIRLSFAHGGRRPCRDRTAEELAALPKNMRTKQICERRRAPVRIEVDIDGTAALAADLAPSGLSGSGPSRVYERFELTEGNYKVDVRMRDDPAVKEFTHTARFDIELERGKSVAIDFDGSTNKFFRH